MVVTAAFTQTHVEAWIRDHTPPEAHCVLTDVSGAYAMLNVQGPASRALLQSVSPQDFSQRGLPVRQLPRDHRSAIRAHWPCG